MYLIYKTDNWHSYTSRVLIGISKDPDGVLRLVKEQAEKENCKLSPDDCYNIRNIYQTQGYEGEGEFDIDVVEVGRLLQ